MKHQYVGDISDFEKYAILRSLAAASGLGLSICWMLTPDDSSTDGRRLTYLDDPRRYRDRDRDVFDGLTTLVRSGERSVHAIESLSLLPDATYFTDELRDHAQERDRYFSSFHAQLTPHRLVFFDPDNGLAPASQKVGRSRSSKYLFPEELVRTYAAGHSVIAFHPWGRYQRAPFLEQTIAVLETATGARSAFAIHGARVVYFVVPQPTDAEPLHAAAASLVARWPSPSRLQLHLM